MTIYHQMFRPRRPGAPLPTNLGHIASVVAMIHAAGRAPTRVGMRVRLKNLPDVLGTDEGPARRPGERLVRWDDRDGAWTINAAQIEQAP